MWTPLHSSRVLLEDSVSAFPRILFIWAAVFLHAGAAFASTVAYWRFEAGPAFTEVVHPGAPGVFNGTIEDVSGNGNHLSAWSQGGFAGYAYRNDVPFGGTIPQTDLTNLYSVKNTGAYPAMFTSAAGSVPTGLNAETITPLQFTVEAFYKPEATGGFRTVVGRDARNVSIANGDLAAFYLQVRPDDSVGVTFTDVSGFTHSAFSPPGWIYGFNFATHPEGATNTPWYSLAGVSDGNTLRVYVDQVLVATTDLTLSASPNRALATGATSGADYRAGAWSIGRGLYAGGHTDRAYGFIDEVRISDAALPPELHLAAARPLIRMTGRTSTSMTFNVSRGYPTAACYLLQASDPAAPLDQWTVHSVRTFDLNGILTATISIDPGLERYFVRARSAWKQPAVTGPLRYQLAAGWENWPADIRAQITYAMDGAVAQYNRYGTFNKVLTVNYNPGVPTAQASYSGWIDFGGSRNYRVALHEISHTLGVGTHWSWSGFLQGGTWTGSHGVQQVREFDGPTASVSSDGTHFWPYGLNYDNEGSTESFRRHVLMVAAFRRDLGIQ
jgi:hypothetical protein